jgi:hypothetical protein
MMRRRALVIAARSLLPYAATASAECGWDGGTSVVDYPGLNSIGGVDLP